MKLWQKTLSVIGGALITLIAVLYVASQVILGASFDSLERKDTRQDVQRALDAASSDLAALDSKNGDWANWDDAYSFVKGDNPEFARVNPTDTSFLQIRINLMVFLQPSGQIVYEKAFDLENQIQVPVPPELHTYLADPPSLEVLLQNQDPGKTLSGILRLPEGPLLIAAHPILTGDGKGPIAGTLIFGRYLDANEIKALATTTNLSLAAYPIDAPNLPGDFQNARSAISEGTPIPTQPLSETTVAGYALLKDVFDKPAVMLRVDESRDVYQQGQDTIRYFMLWVIGIGLTFGVVVHLIANRLWRTRQEQQESEQRYRTVVEQAAEGIFLLDARTKRVLEANAAFRNMLGYGLEEMPDLAVYDIVADDPENILQDLRLVATRGKLHIGERRYRRKDGTLIDTDSSASIVSYGSREVITFVVRDITEQKQAEAERWRLFDQERTRRAELAALYNLSRTLADTTDSQTVLNLVTRQAAETIHATFAGVALLEKDTFVLRAVFPVRPLEDMPGIGYRELDPTQSFFQTIIDQNEPIVLHRADPNIRQSAFKTLFLGDAQSICIVPLRANQRCMGLMILGEARREERERFTPEKIRLAHSIGDQTATALQRAELFDELQRTYLQTVVALARAVDAKDTYTANHAESVSKMALAIGKRLGLSPRELENLRYGAILHDIGKIGVADAVLQKPGRLNTDEWTQMRQHPVIGAQILAPVPRLAGAAQVVRHHHERYDGNGYPDRLAGEAIPLGARILTVVDSYSAITDERVYKAARTQEEAVLELERNAGTQFDARVVAVFLEMLKQDKQHSEEFQGVYQIEEFDPHSPIALPVKEKDGVR